MNIAYLRAKGRLGIFAAEKGSDTEETADSCLHVVLRCLVRMPRPLSAMAKCWWNLAKGLLPVMSACKTTEMGQVDFVDVSRFSNEQAGMTPTVVTGDAVTKTGHISEHRIQTMGRSTMLPADIFRLPQVSLLDQSPVAHSAPTRSSSRVKALWPDSTSI